MKIRALNKTKGLLLLVPIVLLALPFLIRRQPKALIEVSAATTTNASGGVPVYLQVQRLSDALKQNPESHLFRVLMEGQRFIEYNRKTRVLRVLNAGDEHWCSYYLYKGVTDSQIHKVARASGLPAMLKTFGCKEKSYTSKSDCP